MQRLPAWSDTLSVGNEVIDEQHRRLIAFCNRVADFSAVRSPIAIVHFHRLLMDGVKLIDEHFSTEEEVLFKNRCPSFDLHCAEHKDYRDKLLAMLKSGMAGELLASDVYQFAREGLIRHMRERDLRDSAFMKDDQLVPQSCEISR